MEDTRVFVVAERNEPYGSGRGTMLSPANPYQSLHYERDENWEGDEAALHPKTVIHYIQAKTILNKVDSPDIPFNYSLNPYQGCEHGCAYCYARPTHQYWGYNAGIDFEQKILVKEDAPKLLEEALGSARWVPDTVMLSGNTDCYQPLERKLGITRKLLLVFQRFQNPVAIITKNALVCRDIDILAPMAADHLTKVSLSITSINDDLRRRLEPRTSTILQRFKAIERLAHAGIPVSAVFAPIIPSLNSQDLPELVRMAADAGASSATFMMVRLPGPVGPIFERWLHEHYPMRAEKVMQQIAGTHGGKVSDSRFGTRMRGEGPLAQAASALFKMAMAKHFPHSHRVELDTTRFQRPNKAGQLSLF